MSGVVVEEAETRLAKEWDNDEAVSRSCDCMLFELVSVLEFSLASCLGAPSVFRRRSTPETAYEIGYVKYEDERAAGGCEDGGEEG